MTIPLCTVVQVGVNGESPICGGSSPDEVPPPLFTCDETHFDDTFWDSDWFFFNVGFNRWDCFGMPGGTTRSLTSDPTLGWNVNTFRPANMRVTLEVVETGNPLSSYPVSIDMFLDDTDEVQLGSTVTIIDGPGFFTINIELDYTSSMASAGIGAFMINTDTYIGGPNIICIEFIE